jgi:hypothetical protein
LRKSGDDHGLVGDDSVGRGFEGDQRQQLVRQFVAVGVKPVAVKATFTASDAVKVAFTSS